MYNDVHLESKRTLNSQVRHTKMNRFVQRRNRAKRFGRRTDLAFGVCKISFCYGKMYSPFKNIFVFTFFGIYVGFLQSSFQYCFLVHATAYAPWLIVRSLGKISRAIKLSSNHCIAFGWPSKRKAFDNVKFQKLRTTFFESRLSLKGVVFVFRKSTSVRYDF